MVVAAGEDRMTERVVRGDIDTAFVQENVFIALPVQEAGLEGSRDILQG